MSGTDGSSRFQRVQRLFDAALDLPADRRDAWLHEQCGEDRALLAEVAELLQADADPQWHAARAMPDWRATASLPAGTRIGSFTIVRCIGEGGMGAVYEATQQRPQRTVALKTLRAGSDSARARRRFEYESEMLGRLQHPGIAQVHEAGTWRIGDRDVPFLAMELLADARAIDDHVAERSLGTRDTLALFAEVCDAVQHAHQHGVVHRDLKPSNLLVDGDGRAKVIDFGIACALDTDEVRRTLRTETGVILGTIAYMSPEQLTPAAQSPDARTDVYSLGILMFQLLTGRLPHDLDTLPVATAMTVIAARDVPHLDSYGPRRGVELAHELDWILQKATERDRNERYQTVAAIAADVRRFLADQPLDVGPPSTAYRLRKFVRRNRTMVLGALLTMLALVAGAITTAIGWRRAVRAEQVTAQKRAELEQVTYGFWQTGQLVEQIDQIKNGGVVPAVVQQLDAIAARLDGQAIERPSIEAALRTRLARAYTEFGHHDAATRQYERAIAALDEDPDPMPEVRASTLTQFGTVLVTFGKLDRGIAMLREATELAERNQSPLADPPGLPRSRMAYALHQLGRYQDAHRAYDEVLAELEQLAVPEPIVKMQSLLGRGNAARALGRKSEARRDLEAAMQFGRATLGIRDHRTLGAQVDLAILLLADEASYADAEQLLRNVAEARNATLGPAHMQTISTVLNLAFALHRQKKFDDSAELCSEYLELARQAGDGHSIPLLKLRFNLGVAQMMREPAQLQQAEQTFRDLVRDGEAELPKDHWMTFAFHARVGMCRAMAAKATGDDLERRDAMLTDARTELELAVAGLDDKLGGKNRQTIEAAGALADVYEQQADTGLAIALRERFALDAPR